MYGQAFRIVTDSFSGGRKRRMTAAGKFGSVFSVEAVFATENGFMRKASGSCVSFNSMLPQRSFAYNGTDAGESNIQTAWLRQLRRKQTQLNLVDNACLRFEFHR